MKKYTLDMHGLLVVAGFLLLSACNIQVKVPEGGKVTWSGGECLAGQTCAVEVASVSFDETFIAVPEPDYIFAGWRSGDRYFCGGSKISCRQYTSMLEGNDTAEAIIASEQNFFLEPVFELAEYDVGYWRALVIALDEQRFELTPAIYSAEPDPSSCLGGFLKPSYTSRALDVLNKTRRLFEMEGSVYQPDDNPAVQASALMNAANRRIVPAPDKDSDACWSQLAANVAPEANFRASPIIVDPARDMLKWLNNNDDVFGASTGKTRRLLMQPSPRYISYGQLNGWSVLKTRSNTSPIPQGPKYSRPYVAYPFGLVPYLLLEQGEIPARWSFSWVPTNSSLVSPYEYYNDVVISVIDQETGDHLEVSNLHADVENIGINNFLSWDVEGWEYDTTYVVKIDNIVLPGGKIRDVSYRTRMDRSNLVDINYPLEEFDAQDGRYRMEGLFDTPRDRDSYTLSLPGGETTISGYSNFSNQAFTIYLLDELKRPLMVSKKEFTIDLPPGEYAVVISPCDDVRCASNVARYEVIVSPGSR